MVVRARLLALLGGAWHDFEAFATWVRPTVEQLGYSPRVSFDPMDLTRLAVDPVDVVMLYNCLDERSEQGYREEEIEALGVWLEGGGRLLALHAATVAARKQRRLRKLLGGAFVDHPPIGPLDVSCIDEGDPMVAGISPFRVMDELYRHELEPGVRVHLVASNGKEEHPVAWTQQVRCGKVAYLALGHDARAWEHEAFARIMKQSLNWLLEQS